MNRENESNESKRGLNRRDALKGVAAATLVLATGAYGAPKESAPSPRSSSPGRELIRRENAKPGTWDWMLTNTRIDPKTWWRCPWIEGYCSEMSVRAGDTLTLKITGPDGGTLVERSSTLQKTQARRFEFVGKRRKGPAWSVGIYRGEIRLARKTRTGKPRVFTATRQVTTR